jgi:hypothetical protein
MPPNGHCYPKTLALMSPDGRGRGGAGADLPRIGRGCANAIHGRPQQMEGEPS